jgi:predicted MFS family arabinose efflux permease
LDSYALTECRMTSNFLLRRLYAGAVGLHGANELVIAALPLTAVLVLHGSADLVGLLLAIQSSAWLLCTIPAGILVDRASRRRVLLTAALLALSGLAVAAFGVALLDPLFLASGTFVGSAGMVVFVLVTSAVVPDLVGREGLAGANAKLEFIRACATTIAPLVVGALAASQAFVPAFVLAFLLAGLSAYSLSRLPSEGGARDNANSPRRSPLQQVRAGATFVVQEPMLRAIAICAVFWNVGFFALIASFVPFAVSALAIDAVRIGIVQSGYGLGLLAGALTAPLAMRRLGWGAVLLAGPGLSAAAPAILLAAQGSEALLATSLGFIAQFLVGFGPMMWMVCRTSVIQSLTPRDMLGTVGATMQLAVFGVRPLGALIGGALGARLSVDAGIVFAGVLFAMSLVAIASSRLPPRSAITGTKMG